MSLANYRKDMLRCTRCSCCKFVPISSIAKSWRFAYGCPSITKYNFHSYSGGGKLITALSLLEGRIEYSDTLLDIIYKCTACGLCNLSCQTGTTMEVLEILFELRAKCFEDGKAPLPAHKPILDSIKSYDNVWLQPRARRTAWAKGLEIKDLNKEKADVLYFLGCTYAYNPKLQKVARDTVTILKRAGVDFGTLGNKELCCASPAFTIGAHEVFKDYAERNIETFNKLGVSKVITSCAGCYGLFKSRYPRLGKEMNFEMLHITEFFDQLIKEGKIKPTKELPMQVTYHDPCHLGRLSEPSIPSEGKEAIVEGTNIQFVKDVPKVLGMNGVFDPPRNVIQSIPGIELIEMERIREYSWCCGAGGGVKSGYPDFALWTASERIEEAKSTGAEALVTSCPWCESNLGDAIEKNQERIKLYSIAELILQVI